MNCKICLGLAASVTLALLAPLSRAQTSTSAPSTDTTTPATATPTPGQVQAANPAGASTPPGESAVKMEAYNVSDVPINEQILPTSRPFSSVFGFDDDIFSVPRNVTIVSRAQMDAIDIQDVTEFSKLTSSSFTDSNFGSPANPTIRGQAADFFVNGMRQHVGDNGDGMPVDFNSLESVNIVPGPATAVQGASSYVGGYVDMITKHPFFDGVQGFVSATVGSYNTNRWTVDVGGPISSDLAFRFSYSGEDSDGYWYDWIKETTAIYGAIEYRPSAVYDLFMSVNGFWADYRENFGINRPTQALIDDGLYQSGTNINNGTVAGPGNLQNALNVGGGPGGSDVIAWGPVVPVDYREIAQGPASHAHGQEYNWQAIQTFKISPELKVVNNSVAGYTKRDTFNSDGYNEVDDPTWFLDNRTELLFTTSKSEINVGLEEKYLSVLDYTDFFFEPVNVWDLSSTTLRSDLNYTLSKYYPNGFGAVAIPGWPGRVGIQGIFSNDTNNSHLETLSPFVQATFKASDTWSIVAGARIDLSHLNVSDPLTPGASASVGFGEASANVSLIDKITPTVSTYATVNYSENYTGDDADGGGFGLYLDASGNPTLPRSLFSEQSVLYEYGWKLSTDNAKLFTTTDVFYQTRQNKPLESPVFTYTYYGFEISENYQPNRNFYATVGYSWINGSLPASAEPYQAYDTQQIPGGPPDPYANPIQTTGRLRAPGQPLNLFNALGQYTFENGLGIEANVLVTSPMNNDYYGYLKIPTQYDIDATVSYKIGKAQIRLTCQNLTNRHNWEPSDATYGLEGIEPEPGIEVFATVKYKF
jgi:hypothetical protein